MTAEGRLVTVVLRVRDLERASSLDERAFGLELHDGDHAGDDPWTSGRHAAVSWTDGAFMHFALYQSIDGSTTTGAHLAFRVANLEAAHRRAKDAGAVVVHDPCPQPWGRSARYLDADGNVVELTQTA